MATPRCKLVPVGAHRDKTTSSLWIRRRGHCLRTSGVWALLELAALSQLAFSGHVVRTPLARKAPRESACFGTTLCTLWLLRAAPICASACPPQQMRTPDASGIRKDPSRTLSGAGCASERRQPRPRAGCAIWSARQCSALVDGSGRAASGLWIEEKCGGPRDTAVTGETGPRMHMPGADSCTYSGRARGAPRNSLGAHRDPEARFFARRSAESTHLIHTWSACPAQVLRCVP